MLYIGRGSGKDGIKTIGGETTDVPSDSTISITAGNRTGTVAAGLGWVAGDIIYLAQEQGTGAGLTERAVVESYSGTSVVFVSAVDNTYATSGANKAQAIRCFEWTEINFTANVNFFCKAWDGDTGGRFPHLVTGRIRGTGTLSLKGRGFRGGKAGRHFGNNQGGQQGESYNGLGTQSTAANSGGGGGGEPRVSGEQGHGGGGAGHRTAGTVGGTAGGGGPGNPGAGGAAYDDALFATHTLGSGGGGGGHGDTANSEPQGQGGNGGGCLDMNVGGIDSGITLDLRGDDGVTANGDQGGGGGGSPGAAKVRAGDVTVGNWIAPASAGGAADISAAGGGSGVGGFYIQACSIAGSATNPAATEAKGGHSWCTTAGFIY